MKFNSPEHSTEPLISFIFDPHEAVIISEIDEQYLKMEFSEDPDAFEVSSIIQYSLEFYDGNTALSIDLTYNECPMFIEKMNQVSTLYLSDQITKWTAKTDIYPEWLTTEKVDSNYSASIVDHDKLVSPQLLAQLDQESAKLRDAKKITLRFQQMARELNEAL